MQIITEHKNILMGLLLSTFLLLLQAQPIMNVLTPMADWLFHGNQNQAKKTSISIQARHVRPVVRPIKLLSRIQVGIPVHAPQAAVVSVSVMDLNRARLNSNSSEYHLVFKGHVTCDGMPCAAQIDVMIDSKQNDGVHSQGHTSGDGSYSMALPIREVTQESLDWKITVANHIVDPKELHGQLILMDDPELSVENNISL